MLKTSVDNCVKMWIKKLAFFIPQMQPNNPLFLVHLG